MYYYLHAARCTPDLLRTRYLGIQGSIDVKYCDMKKGRETEIEAIASSEPRSRANPALAKFWQRSHIRVRCLCLLRLSTSRSTVWKMLSYSSHANVEPTVPACRNFVTCCFPLSHHFSLSLIKMWSLREAEEASCAVVMP